MSASNDLARVKLRPSSLYDLFDCALRWSYKNLDGIHAPSGPAAHLGSSLHHSTAVFDAARLRGQPVSVDDAAGELIDALHNPDREVDWQGAKPSDMEDMALLLHTRYCNNIAPRRDYVAVEVRCEGLVIDFPHDGVALEIHGTADRVYRLDDGRLRVADIKSGGRVISNGEVTHGGHLPQIGTYAILAQHALGEPVDSSVEIIALSTATGDVEAKAFGRAREALVGSDEIPGLLQHAAQMIGSGSFPPNPGSPRCAANWCPAYALCPYHD